MSKEFPKLLIADKEKQVYDFSDLEATGMKGGKYFRLEAKDLIKLHPDSELFLLPDRSPVGYSSERKSFIDLKENPFTEKKEPCYSVAAFLAPGFTVTHSASYKERAKARTLPLFSYAAVCFYKNEFYAAGVRVDKEKRQDLSGPASTKSLPRAWTPRRSARPSWNWSRHRKRKSNLIG